MTYKKTITFFLGAGFSAPAKYPVGLELNEKLREFNLSELIEPANEKVSTRIDNSESIKLEYSQIHGFLLAEYFHLHSDFNYEEFYDHYHMYSASTLGPQYGNKRRQALQDIIGIGSIEDILLKYDEFYNRILYQQFQRSEVNEQQYYHLYSEFIKFIKYLLDEKYTINVFSLNHDRLLENLFAKHSIPYSDGFEKQKLRYYLEKDPTNKVFHFTGKYKEKLKIYKLHGSVDLFYIFKGKNICRLKIENINNLDFYSLATIKEKNGTYKSNLLSPYFLTGKNMKPPVYKYNQHFKDGLDTLKRKITRTNKLIIIGYGFGDEHIQNNYLKPAFQKEGVVTVVDEGFSSNFLNDNIYRPLKKYLQKVSCEEYLKIINEKI